MPLLAKYLSAGPTLSSEHISDWVGGPDTTVRSCADCLRGPAYQT